MLNNKEFLALTDKLSWGICKKKQHNQLKSCKTKKILMTVFGKSILARSIR